MDAADAWGRSSSSSSSSSAAAAARRLQSRYDLYMGFDDADAGGDEAVEARGGTEPYNCPFCGEDYDFVSLCCHIDDEHAVETKSGVCPICATRVGMDLIGHLTMQHGSYFKISFLLHCCQELQVILHFSRNATVENTWACGDHNLHIAFLNEQHMQRRRRVRKISSGSHSLLSLLRKDWRDGSLHSFLGSSSYVSHPPAAAPDPSLSSLICSLPVAETSKDLHSDSSDNNFLLNKFPDERTVERTESLSEKDQEERAQRSEFARGLVLSTIFDDNL